MGKRPVNRKRRPEVKYKNATPSADFPVKMAMWVSCLLFFLCCSNCSKSYRLKTNKTSRSNMVFYSNLR